MSFQNPHKHIIYLLQLVAATFFSLASIQGQSTISLPLQILAAGGGEANSSNLQVDFTIGEPVAELSTSNSLYLNQGFQQHHFDDIDLVTQNISLSDINLTLYPNPIQNYLIIEKTKEVDISLIQIYNLLGQLIFENQFPKDILRIDSRAWQAGSYFIHIENREGQRAQKTIIKH